MAETLVPLPPGFVLDAQEGEPTMPQLPPGFVLDEQPAAPAKEDVGVLLGKGGLKSDWGLGSEILNGMVFGTLPNIDAAVTGAAKSIPFVGNGKSLSENYTADLEQGQADRREYRKEHPFWATGGEVAGGVLTGTGLVKNGVTLSGQIANKGLSNILPRMAAGSAEGMAFGAASGFGGGEGGFDNRVQGAQDNLLMGAILGAAAPVAIDAVSGVGGAAKNIYKGIKDPEGRAKDALISRIMADKTSPDELALKVTGAKMENQPDYAAVDAAGKNTRGLLKMASRTPGEFGDTAEKFATTRQAGQGDRLSTYVDDALGVKGASAFQTEADLIAGRKAAAQGNYEEAYSTMLPDSPFYDELAQKPIVQQAIKNMDLAARNSVDGMKDKINIDDMYLPVPAGAQGTTGETGGVRKLSSRGWDYVKRYLDKYVDGLYSSPNADEKALAPVYKDLRDTLKGQLSKDNPAYAKALSQFSDDTSSIDAIDSGRKLANARNPDEAKAAFGKLDDNQKDFARVGASREFGVKMDNSSKDRLSTFNTTNTKGKMDVLAKDDLQRAIFDSRVSREMDMAKTNNAVKGGSDTASNLAEGVDLGPGGSALGALFAGHPLRAAGYASGRVLGKLHNAATGLTDETAKNIGDYLLNTNPAQINELADLFVQRMQQSTKPSVGPTVLNAAIQAPRQANGTEKEMRVTVPNPNSRGK